MNGVVWEWNKPSMTSKDYKNKCDFKVFVWATVKIKLPSTEMELIASKIGLMIWVHFFHVKFDSSVLHVTLDI